MRYESFYPFANNQSSPNTPRQYPPASVHPLAGPWQQPQSSPQSRPFQDPFSEWAPNRNQNAQQQGPSKMEAYMQTADKFLNTAQQFAPVVQQIAPMMRNLPAMWRLYKGFQSMPDSGSPPSGGSAPSTARPSAPPANGGFDRGPQPSVPRIFQPPRP